MDNSPYNSDSGSSAASGISAIARYSQSKRDRKTGRSPFERAVKNAVSAELSRLYPMPPMHLSSEYNKMANQRKTARPAIESRIRQEMMQQQQGREESPVSQGSFSHGSVPPSPMQIRSITPVPGTPMPVRMLQYNGTGETPQRHRMESLFERMASQVLANNSEQTNILAAALLQANDQARQDAQSKNVDALKCALDKNDEARKDTQNKNNEALQHALQHVTNKNKEALDRALHENNQARKDTQSMNDEALKTCTTANQHGIQELVSQHQERNSTALQQIFGAMPEFMADGNGFGNDDESPLVTHDNNADATEFVEQAGDVTKELFVENAGGGPAQETTTNPMIGSGNSGIAGDADISIADISIADTSIADTPIADIPIADTTIHNPDVSTSESAKKPAPKEDLTDLVRGRSSTKKRLHVGDSDAATPSIGKRQRVSNVRLSADKKTTPVSYQTPAVRSSSHRQAGLPPRAPKTSSAVKTHSVAKGLSSVKKAMNPSATMAPRRAPIWTVTRFFIASPGGTSYFLGDVSGWQDRVVQWSMSQYRLSFLLTDGTVAVFPFLKREGEAKACMGEINKSLIRSGKGWRVISVAARGPHTFTLERDAPDNQRRIKRQTGDDPTELLQIGGLKDGTLIDRLFPGDGYLVLIYQDNTLDLVRDDQVVDSWEEMVKSSLGEHYGKTIGDVFVGGLFVLAKLVVTGEIFCVRKFAFAIFLYVAVASRRVVSQYTFCSIVQRPRRPSKVRHQQGSSRIAAQLDGGSRGIMWVQPLCRSRRQQEQSHRPGIRCGQQQSFPTWAWG